MSRSFHGPQIGIGYYESVDPNTNRNPHSEGSGNRGEVHSPTRTSTEVRSPTRTSTEVRSPTRTATEVRSPTSTSTDAYTQGNFTSTVTGGAGSGNTTVNIYAVPLRYTRDSRGRKQLAKSAMDVKTTGPAASGLGDRTPQVVTSPEEGDALLLPQQKAAKSALQVLGIFAAGVAAVWVGKEAVGYLRGDT